jgi:mono/diheme cytochrome c family protein
MLNLAAYFRLLLMPLAVAVLAAAEGPQVVVPPPHPLVWDALEKTVDVPSGQNETKFTFNVTNTSKEPVEVTQVDPSCGCTVAELPATPWILAPGAKGSFTAVVEHRGKFGKLYKSLYVHSTSGSQTLAMLLNIPETEESRRVRNQQFAMVDRQLVFRGECASCHTLPTMGKIGEPLFQAACGICHSAASRASMVPDLKIAREPRDAAYWERWISEGKERSLMPAFAAKHGGPLTTEQIQSLVEYVLHAFPKEPAKQ